MLTSHIVFDDGAFVLRLLDQRFLPREERRVACATASDVALAIKNMTVRGAPAIGVAAAYGCVLAAAKAAGSEWRKTVAADLAALREARPTAVNLAWAVDRMARLLPQANSPEEIAKIWLAEAKAIQAEDIAICQKLGANGADLIPDGATVLTHCNAGALATAGHGTALGVIRSAWTQGKKVAVVADETRPLLQGARLTAYELSKDGIPVKIACDNACAHLMRRGDIDIVITGADRVAANGDAANKIGTLGVAIMAAYFDIPFYVAAPLSTMDMRSRSGGDIVIEERDEAEVLNLSGHNLAPDGVGAINFAFDVTPAKLINAIITEVGVLRAPYEKSLATALASGKGGPEK